MTALKDKKQKKHAPVHVARNLFFMLRYTVKYTPAYIPVTLCEAVLASVYHIVQVLFAKYLLDSISAAFDFWSIMKWLSFKVLCDIIYNVYNKWRLEIYIPKANLSLHEGVQSELYKKARELDQSCYDDPEFYNDFIWAIRESDARIAKMMMNFSGFFTRLFSCIVLFGVLVSIDKFITVALIITVVLGVTVRNIRNKVYLRKNEELNPIERKLSYISRVFYLQDYAKELRQGGIAEHMQNEYADTTDVKIACTKKYIGKLLVLSSVSNFLNNDLPHTGVVSYFIIRYVVDRSFSLGDFSASIFAGFKIAWMLRGIGEYFNTFNEHSLYIEKVRKFIGYEPKIKGSESDIEAFESLKIENLDFAYPFAKEDKKVLNNIGLEIKKGEKIALVGYNGAGKTTLIKLIMRLYDATSGAILYNGRNITEFEPDKYREHIGAVFQDYKLFAATLAENVMGGDYSDSDKESVINALSAASFDDKLTQLPNGIHTLLTTEFSRDGVELSGGEAQKIAIARVFARPYELIIMDEPSSALSPIAEYELNQSILKNAENKTVIFISHRLSTTRIADRIYMFDSGEIVEQGSHDVLMAQNGKYAEMYRVQAKKYSTDGIQ